MRRFAALGKGWGLPLTLAALAAAGCSPATGSISGKVVYTAQDGAHVVKGGYVNFTAADGSRHSADISKEGTYTVENVPLGDAKVSVDTSSLKPNPNAPNMGNRPPNDPNLAAAKDAAERYVWIPDKYADPASSGLTVTVKAGNNPYDPPIK